jgi:hypothetical protein
MSFSTLNAGRFFIVFAFVGAIGPASAQREPTGPDTQAPITAGDTVQVPVDQTPTLTLRPNPNREREDFRLAPLKRMAIKDRVEYREKMVRELENKVFPGLSKIGFPAIVPVGEQLAGELGQMDMAPPRSKVLTKLAKVRFYRHSKSRYLALTKYGDVNVEIIGEALGGGGPPRMKGGKPGSGHLRMVIEGDPNDAIDVSFTTDEGTYLMRLQCDTEEARARCADNDFVWRVYDSLYEVGGRQE